MEEKDETKVDDDQGRSMNIQDIKPQQKRSAVIDFVEQFGSQYELNFTGVGDNPPSDVGSKVAI